MSDFIFTEKPSIRLKFLILVGIVFILIMMGTLFYHFVEGWGYVDSFYFSSISLSTRGYGGLYPTKAVSKIFTAFYLFLGMAFILYAFTTLIGDFVSNKEPAIRKKMSTIVNNIAPPKKERWLVLKPPKT